MANPQRRPERNPGIDLMRAIAMFFVICLHFVEQGGLIAHADPGSGKYYFLIFIQILSLLLLFNLIRIKIMKRERKEL